MVVTSELRTHKVMEAAIRELMGAGTPPRFKFQDTYASIEFPDGYTVPAQATLEAKYNELLALEEDIQKTVIEGDLEVGTSNLFVDTETGRVGVGRTDPQVELDVSGVVNVSSNLEVGTSNLFVDTETGRVGVGTASPGATLDVNGSARFVGNVSLSGYIKSNNKLLVSAYSGDGTSSYPALSGWHLAQLNNMYSLGLTNGYYYIQSPRMPNKLQMYVNFTADGGGYDFYRFTGATSRNYVYESIGSESLGIDMFYPRSKAHWVAIYDFVVNVCSSTIASDIKVPGKVYRRHNIFSSGNYTTAIMRDWRYYGSGAPDWMVPDRGKWFLRDSTYGEPNGDYSYYAYLSLFSVTSAGVITFNDGNASPSSGTVVICSTNVKGSTDMYD